jgi:hypothetical protein
MRIDRKWELLKIKSHDGRAFSVLSICLWIYWKPTELRLLVGFFRQQNLRWSSDQYFSQFPIIQTWAVNFFRALCPVKNFSFLPRLSLSYIVSPCACDRSRFPILLQSRTPVEELAGQSRPWTMNTKAVTLMRPVLVKPKRDTSDAHIKALGRSYYFSCEQGGSRRWDGKRATTVSIIEIPLGFNDFHRRGNHGIARRGTDIALLTRIQLSVQSSDSRRVSSFSYPGFNPEVSSCLIQLIVTANDFRGSFEFWREWAQGQSADTRLGIQLIKITFQGVIIKITLLVHKLWLQPLHETRSARYQIHNSDIGQFIGRNKISHESNAKTLLSRGHSFAIILVILDSAVHADLHLEAARLPSGLFRLRLYLVYRGRSQGIW